MRTRARGFVLVATLAMLVVLSILAAGIAATTQRLRDDELQRKRQVEDAIAMAGTRDTVLYLLATQRMTFAGVTVDDQVVLSDDQRRAARDEGADPAGLLPVGNEVRLDGTVYEGLGGIRFALQDDRGLVSVNWAGDAIRQAWLEQLSTDGNLPQPMATLSNLLKDYQDPDSLYRLNSAEDAGYTEAGLAPPTNQPLGTPLELRRVMGWREALASASDMQLLDSATIARSPTLNVNTAPVTVLASLPGIDRDIAQRVVDARRLQPFTLRSEFYRLAGVVPPVGEDALSLYPSASGTLKMWPSRGGEVQVLHWTLTPLDDGGRPWREDYEFTLPLDRELAGAAARKVASALFADPAAAPQ